MITVHVGLHKTGSTSIQAALRLIEHRTDLQIVMPCALDDSSSMTSALARDASKRVIISDENILGSMVDAYALAPHRLSLLRTLLEGRPFEIVMYVRPQAQWLASVYLQLVQQGQVLSSEQFWASIRSKEYLEWPVLVRLIEESSGAARVRLRAFTDDRDAVADFFACCGLGKVPPAAVGGIRENISIAASQAPILAALNRDDSLKAADRLRLRHVFQDQLASGARRGFSPFTEQVQLEIAGHYRSGWAELAEMLNEQDPAEAAVFRDSLAALDAPPKPFAGASLSDPLVAEEMLRTVHLLATSQYAATTANAFQRFVAKATGNPRDLPSAAIRSIRRMGRRS